MQNKEQKIIFKVCKPCLCERVASRSLWPSYEFTNSEAIQRQAPIQNSKFKIQNSSPAPRGFSLMELLIVVSIIALLGSAGVGFYRGFIKDVEIKSASKIIASDLGQMRAKSMAGDSGYKWGVRFVKSASGDYYYTFSTNGTNSTTTATTTLSSGVTFSDPATGYKEVVFNKISGTIAAATTTSITVEGQTATTTISIIGVIY